MYLVYWDADKSDKLARPHPINIYLSCGPHPGFRAGIYAWRVWLRIRAPDHEYVVCAGMQRQTVVTAYLKSKQLLLFAFAQQYTS